MGQLTRNSNGKSTIHDTATAKSIQYPSTRVEPVRESRGNLVMADRPARAATTREMSIDIDAQPLSSTDEEEREAKTPEPPKRTPRSKKIYDGFDRIDGNIRGNQRSQEEGRGAGKHKKIKSAGARETRSNKMADDPLEITIADEEEQRKGAEEMSDEEARWDSWQEPAPKKRKFTLSNVYHGAGWANVHAHATNSKREAGIQPVPTMPFPPRYGRNTRSGFQAPGELKSPNLEGRHLIGFVVPTANDLPDRRKTRSKVKDEDDIFKLPDDILSPRSATANSTTFRLPPDSTTSSATTTGHASTVFSHPDSPPLARSRSASSLSSVDSIASLLLTQDEKNELMKDDHLTSTETPDPTLLTAQCPLCSSPVSNLLLEEFTIRHAFSRNQTRLPSRLQQIFCREHRARTARDTWQDRGYPDIDWDRLATTRITRHLQAMRSILYNKTPSFYRDRLVDAIQAGKGRRNLLKYLKEDVLDVVKYGYYGPRGAKVAAEAITLRLSKELKEVVKSDVVVTEPGAGGFVQAVLVPEMMGRWVAEDRGLRLEGEEWKVEARRVLEESCEVGGLVNEDEDRVFFSHVNGGWS